jgi:E3 ubiquitin-protein ligase RNF5
VANNKRKREADDDLFGDVEDPEVVDLVDKDEVPADIINNSQKEKEKNWVKLGALDCVICMDNATDLTVTHCGKRAFPFTAQAQHGSNE